MFKLVLIFLGAGLGGILRYWLGTWLQSFTTSGFPIGTLAVNTLGCLAIGFLAAALTGPAWGDERYRLALIVGLLGGFTTFSAFGYETVSLAGHREFLLAGLNILLSNGLGLVGVWLGARMAPHLSGV
jgi:CrcB protein